LRARQAELQNRASPRNPSSGAPHARHAATSRAGFGCCARHARARHTSLHVRFCGRACAESFFPQAWQYRAPERSCERSAMARTVARITRHKSTPQVCARFGGACANDDGDGDVHAEGGGPVLGTTSLLPPVSFPPRPCEWRGLSSGEEEQEPGSQVPAPMLPARRRGGYRVFPDGGERSQQLLGAATPGQHVPRRFARCSATRHRWGRPSAVACRRGGLGGVLGRSNAMEQGVPRNPRSGALSVHGRRSN
jgi:hypothetical protein